MTNVLLGLLLWIMALIALAARHKTKEIASKYGLPQWPDWMTGISTFLFVAAGAALIAVGMREALR